MKRRPILFMNGMIQAILGGRKTQTRRIIKLDERGLITKADAGAYQPDHEEANRLCPYGLAGDRLWVKESYYAYGQFRETGELTASGRKEMQFVDLTSTLKTAGYYYAADDTISTVPPLELGYHLRPSIFMPRRVTRITLEITKVRIERVQDITGPDAIAEGIVPQHMAGLNVTECLRLGVNPQERFSHLWDRVNGERASWESNPYVWVIEFKKL